MEDYQQRIVGEKAELDARILKLKAFIDGEIYESLPTQTKRLMYEQSFVMERYSYILAMRLGEPMPPKEGRDAT